LARLSSSGIPIISGILGFTHKPDFICTIQINIPQHFFESKLFQRMQFNRATQHQTPNTRHNTDTSHVWFDTNTNWWIRHTFDMILMLIGEFFGTHIMWTCTGIFVEVDRWFWLVYKSYLLIYYIKYYLLTKYNHLPSRIPVHIHNIRYVLEYSP
jgi:hypothetical protein